MKIRIYTTLNGKVINDYNTTAKTWGVLKAQLIGDGYYNEGGSKAVLRETKATLEADGIVLPPAGMSTYTVFITPTKTKSGATYQLDDDEVQDLVDYVMEHAVEDIEANIKDFIENYEIDDEASQLAQEVKSLNIN